MLVVRGLVYLTIQSDRSVALVAAANWVFYAACYTPLKSRTAWQLPVGAVAGAMPMLIGSAVAGAPLSALSLALFGIVFCWQFPHAMAIAWIYREQYARAGLRVASVSDPPAVGPAFWPSPERRASCRSASCRRSCRTWRLVRRGRPRVRTGLPVPGRTLLARANRPAARQLLWASFFTCPWCSCSVSAVRP